MNIKEYLLTCLIEECAEIQKDACKALRFGLDDIKPGDELDNAEKIAREGVDLVAILEMLEDAEILPRRGALQAIEAKKEKVRLFMEYSREKGALSAWAISPN